MLPVGKGTRYCYVRFYEDGMLVCKTNINNTVTVDTWFKLSKADLESNYRKGIPVYKKN